VDFHRDSDLTELKRTRKVRDSVTHSRLVSGLRGLWIVDLAVTANWPLLNQITFQQSGATKMTTTKQYDYLHRLLSVSSGPSSAGVVPLSFNYAYNDANQGEKWEAFQDRHGDWGRDLELFLGRREAGLPLRELGGAVGGVDYAAVSVAIRRFERRLVREKSLQKSVEVLRTKLLNVET